MNRQNSQTDPPTSHDAFVDAVDKFLDECTSAAKESQSQVEFYQWLSDRLRLVTMSSNVIVWVETPDENCFPAIVSATADPKDLSKQKLSGQQFRKVHSMENAAAFKGKDFRVIASPVFKSGKEKKVLAVYRTLKDEGEFVQIVCELLAAVVEIIDQFESRFVFSKQNERIAKLNQFVELLKNSQGTLNSKELGHHITNDVRAIVQADRVWLFQTQGRIRHLACSGATNVDSRSQALKDVRSLVKEANRYKESYFFSQKNKDQIPKKYRQLRKFMEAFSMCGLYLILLKKKKGRGFSGALVVECFSQHDEMQMMGMLNSTAVCVENSLENCLTWERLPFRNSLRALGAITEKFSLATLPKTLVFFVVLAALIASLFLIKTDFAISVPGEIQPVVQQNVFAPAKGIVKGIMVQYGDRVDVDQPLIALRSPDYELTIERLVGETQTLRKTLATNEIRLTQANQTQDAVLSAQLSAEIEQNKLDIRLLQTEIDFYQQRTNSLQMLSPIHGQVVSKDLRRNLLNRPVEAGERLATIADIEGEWQIVFKVPDKELGYLHQATQNGDVDKLRIDYKLTFDVEKVYSCDLTSFDKNITVDRFGNSVVEAYGDIPPDLLPEMRIGQTVHAKIHCGKKSLFFVWTRGLRDFMRSKFLWPRQETGRTR